MDANKFFEKTITEENCNWSEFQQCSNHKWTITEMMKDFTKEQLQNLCGDLFQVIKMDYAHFDNDRFLHEGDLFDDNRDIIAEALRNFYYDYWKIKNNEVKEG